MIPWDKTGVPIKYKFEISAIYNKYKTQKKNGRDGGSGVDVEGERRW